MLSILYIFEQNMIFILVVFLHARFALLILLLFNHFNGIKAPEKKTKIKTTTTTQIVAAVAITFGFVNMIDCTENTASNSIGFECKCECCRR